MTDKKRTRVESLFQTSGPIITAGTMREHRIYNRDIAELLKSGDIQKLKTGYYIWDAIAPDVPDIEAVATLIPFGIICLQSAAHFHDLTTLNPLVISIAVPANRTRVATPAYPPVELIAYPLPTFELGAIEAGSPHIRIYDRERTVCDFFRKRRQLGDDLALDIMQTYMRGTRNLQKLFDYAGILRIKGVIKPYVEALT
jgi:predicted transcriptional regulator of viral defense system